MQQYASVDMRMNDDEEEDEVEEATTLQTPKKPSSKPSIPLTRASGSSMTSSSFFSRCPQQVNLSSSLDSNNQITPDGFRFGSLGNQHSASSSSPGGVSWTSLAAKWVAGGSSAGMAPLSHNDDDDDVGKTNGTNNPMIEVHDDDDEVEGRRLFTSTDDNHDDNDDD